MVALWMTNTLLTLFNSARYQEYHRAGYWRDDTIYSLVRRHASEAPGRTAVRSAHRTLTYQQLLTAADDFASDLAANGVLTGQRVAVWLPSRVETVIAVVACSRNGYVCCPSLHRDHTVAEIIELLERIRAAAVIGEAGYGADGNTKDFFAAVAKVPTIRRAYRIEKGRDAIELAATPNRNAGGAAPPANPNRVLYLAYTSGTRGKPKGVMHSDNTLLANARAFAADWNISEAAVVYFTQSAQPQFGLWGNGHGARGREPDRRPRPCARAKPY